MSAGDLLFRGAEAELHRVTWMGRAAVAKARVAKGYRHASLDARLRAERTRDEAHLLVVARRAGVSVPVLYDVDRAHATLRMEFIEGKVLREVLEADGDDMAQERLRHLGRVVACLHDADVTHGDLTTSNVMVPVAGDAASLVLVDLGLGRTSNEVEDRAVDLHLMEEALEATEARAASLFAAFLAGYEAAASDADATLRRLEAVRERGRYRGAA